MKINFCTNLPSPYRVDFFNELGKYCDLTVLYERKTSSERNEAWKGKEAVSFNEVYLDLKLVGVDQSRGPALKNYIKEHSSDILIFTNYVSPATVEAIFWCKIHQREYYIEYDGGFYKKDTFLKGILKRLLLKGAVGHLTTAEEHIKYLISLGIDRSKIHKYPFTSISEDDIVRSNTLSIKGKAFFKQKLGIHENIIILSVGRFSYDEGYGKGYDILMKLSETINSSVGIYIVGDNPTQEFVELKKNKHLDNVHFVGFKSKEELAEYYAAADLFTILSRGDVWGLVVNEAMAFGLPVITSSQCIAGTELVENGVNGYVVDINDYNSIGDKFERLIANESMRISFGYASFDKIIRYTFKTMCDKHLEILGGARNCIKYFSKSILGINEKRIVVAVGQFIHRKGFDVLIKAASKLDDSIGIYIIGGEPTPEYIELVTSLNIHNVHFVGFRTKQELTVYYEAADCVAFPTREDIWGLITNESMAFGVPIVASDKCISALEMINIGENGYVVPVEDYMSLANHITKIMDRNMFFSCYSTAMKYTIESMALAHRTILHIN